jgi:hypothetical protein
MTRTTCVGLAVALPGALTVAACGQPPDTCQQLVDAIQNLQSRMANCNNTETGSAAECETWISSCSAADVQELDAFARCLNGISGGDCNTDPNLVEEVSTALDACTSGVKLSPACGGDAGFTELNTATSSQSVGGCPLPGPSTLGGAGPPGTACTDAYGCAPVCCSCSDGQFLAAACQNGACAPTSSICSLAESQRSPDGTCAPGGSSTTGGTGGGGGCLQNSDCPAIVCPCTNDPDGGLTVQFCSSGICASCPATVCCETASGTCL